MAGEAVIPGDSMPTRLMNPGAVFLDNEIAEIVIGTLQFRADAGHIGMNIFFFQKRQKFAGALIKYVPLFPARPDNLLRGQCKLYPGPV